MRPQALAWERRNLPRLRGRGLHMPDSRPATKDELYGFYDHLETELDASGFFKTDKLKPSMMRNLRNLFARAAMTEQEVRSLRGVISSLVRKHLRVRKRAMTAASHPAF